MGPQSMDFVVEGEAVPDGGRHLAGGRSRRGWYPRRSLRLMREFGEAR
jgi:hypothetical protein